MHFVRTVAICNETFAFFNKQFDAFCNKQLDAFCNKIVVSFVIISATF